MLPPTIDRRKMAIVLAEDIDDALNAIYQSATGKAPDYAEVLEWILSTATTDKSSSIVHKQLVQLSEQRGLTVVRKDDEKTVTITPSEGKSQPRWHGDVNMNGQAKKKETVVPTTGIELN